MRFAINCAIILAIGLVIGGWSAQFGMQRAYGIGAIRSGVWAAWPFVGGLEVDPYTAARITMEGALPLGAAEGLTFEASSDDQGQDLERQCSYELAGGTPPAQIWTLAAYSPDGSILKFNGETPSALLSSDTVRAQDFAIRIKVGRTPSSGNWLKLDGKGKFKMIMRLYDTPITSSAGIGAPSMPNISRLECGQ